ncbi:MAG: hypothetical protein JW900_07510 [Anaerolineae bacterium]|nr:hypothetical protein [Anaerolineae bacterium]
MRVIVVLGHVLDPRGIAVNRRAGRVFINRREYILQPADRCALEAALRIKDEMPAEVVVLPRSPLPDDDVLRQALATGADRAVYLAGDGLAAADDAAMARLLAAAVERLGGADLILTGATTLDTGQGQLGLRLAEALGWPHVADAWALKTSDDRLEVVRQEGAGYAVLEAALPVMVTVAPGALEPRYPDGARLINIYRGQGEVAAALETWDAADLVDADALQPLLERRGQEFPPERERGVRASGGLEEMARSAADALRRQVRV